MTDEKRGPRVIATSDRWRVEEHHNGQAGEVLLVPWRLGKCEGCGKRILPSQLQIPWFGSFYFKRARKELDLVDPYEGPEVDKTLCVGCAEAGDATFACALCKEPRRLDQIEESFGDPPERLCKPCYASVPAKTWDETQAKLREAHRYDFD